MAQATRVVNKEINMYHKRLLRLAMFALALGGPAAGQEVPQPTEPPPPAVPSPAVLANPAVRATLSARRESPRDYLRDVINLLDLGEPELAANYFRELVALKLDDQAKADLVAEFGPATMLRLSRAPVLGPEAKQFTTSAMSASAARDASQVKVDDLLEQLASEDSIARRNAVAGLAGVGMPAVVPLVGLLADDTLGQPGRQAARAALVRLGPLAERPLLATLTSGNPKLQAEAAELLAARGTPQAAPLLATAALEGGSAARAYQSLTGQTPSVGSATGLLERTLKTTEGGAPVFVPNADGHIEYWVWNPKVQPGPIALTLTTHQASTLYAAELTKQLAKLNPNDERLASKALRLELESVAVLGEQDLEVGYNLEKFNALSLDQLDRLLREALKRNQVAAATLALEAIAERGDASVLITADGRPSPTARALEHAHPNVRFAALEAIAAIDLPSPFPGASKVCPAIVSWATASGSREVLVGAPRLDVAATWGGGLAALGFEPQAATTGKDLIDRARMRADIELVLVDMAIGRPGVRDVVFGLRRESSTALVPIVLLARESQLTSARSIASQHEGVLAYPRPHSDELLVEYARTALAELPRDWPTPAKRQENATQALVIMEQLLAKDREFYRLRAASGMIAQNVRPGPAGQPALDVLAKLGTRDSQLTLLQVASALTFDLQSRQQAANAFGASVQQFGLRITTSEITRQYNLYNASESDTSESQQILGDLLDTIEAGRDERPQSP